LARIRTGRITTRELEIATPRRASKAQQTAANNRSLMQRTNSASQIVWRQRHEAYGTASVQEDPDGNGQLVTLNARFPGQYFDVETGLHYNYFRDYDPAVGRYVQSDPIGLEGGLNTYEYAFSDPLSNEDPEGLYPIVREVIKEVVKRLPKKSPKKSPIKPDKFAGMWNCAVVACCNDNIPGNCPEDPTQWCKQAVWRDKVRATAINLAETLAKQRLGCQAKHVTVRCTGPRGEPYHRGG
jgi:RHS repeat-associated protein